MNAMGLPGAKIDGILGYSALARFRIEIDPTSDRMTWTRLEHDPQMPAMPFRKPGEGVPPEVAAMDLMGPMAKFAAMLVGMQPEEQLHPRGLPRPGTRPGRGRRGARREGARRLAAAMADVREGDVLVTILGARDRRRRGPRTGRRGGQAGRPRRAPSPPGSRGTRPVADRRGRACKCR